MNNFDILPNSIPIKDDINVTFTPSENVTTYQYRIFKNSDNNLTKNGEIVNPTLIYKEYVTVNNNNPVLINLTETGVYQLEIVENYSDGSSKIVNSGLYVIDKEAPKIEINNYHNQIIEYKNSKSLEQIESINAFDNFDGNVTNKITSNKESINFSKKGVKELTYTVEDQAGNQAIKTLKLNVVGDNSAMILMWQIIIIVLTVLSLVYLYFYNKYTKLDKRLSKYSIEPMDKSYVSIVDKIINLYLRIIERIKNIISKSVFITKHSVKFDKYVGIVDNIHKDSLELISSKIFVSIVVLFLAIFSRTIQFKVLIFEEYFIPLIIGYLIPNIFYTLKYRQYRSRLEEDLLQAIIVMNNAFKSGRSIIQAIELVTNELKGPIADEFKLVHLQLKFGISIDDAFKKFADRINIEEVSYLTASLSILSKTGGNIIKVFSSIEKTLFNKKKLKLELKSLTGSSRIIMYFLTALPLFLILVISFVNPDYFLSLYTTPIGFILLFVIFIIYISYIVVIRKVMRVRM